MYVLNERVSITQVGSNIGSYLIFFFCLTVLLTEVFKVFIESSWRISALTTGGGSNSLLKIPHNFLTRHKFVKLKIHNFSNVLVCLFT